MKITNRPHLDLWISGLALLLAMLMLLITSVIRHDSRHGRLDRDRVTFAESSSH